MKALSDKYIAGFLDADGSIRLDRQGRLWMEFCQKQTNDGVIDLIHDVVGGSRLTRVGRRRGKRTVGGRCVLSGKRAVSMLERLKKHLVVKAQKAEDLLAQVQGREAAQVSPKVHPSRAWLAGYFDGDGMVHAAISNSKYGSASVRVSITSNTTEMAGLQLVSKAFGGTVRCRENTARFEMTVDAAKAKKFFGFFAKHSTIKREQIYYVLGCADMGHFRDGETIVATLKAMKTHPHRLSDLHTDVDVSGYLKEVRNLPAQRGQHREQHCDQCGAGEHYAKGLCNSCYQRQRYRYKRQSA